MRLKNECVHRIVHRKDLKNLIGSIYVNPSLDEFFAKYGILICPLTKADPSGELGVIEENVFSQREATYNDLDDAFASFREGLVLFYEKNDYMYLK